MHRGERRFPFDDTLAETVGTYRGREPFEHVRDIRRVSHKARRTDIGAGESEC